MCYDIVYRSCGDAPVWSIYLERDRAPAAIPFEKTLEVIVTTGNIKKVVSDRGFGFITGTDGNEYFFHRDGLSGSLDFDRLLGGEKVEFDIEQGPKGARAKNVQSA